ncbi:MAG: OPT/YSL family transporter [Verrucomicrobia bacterium]|nr:OPT/YSL family transporter [Verrucomicrobiota bacterium]
MPQLTIRSGLTGMMLGGVLSLTNLYVGAKTGWTLGVGITSVILAFAMFKALSRLGLAREFTVLENNAMQSIATAAGYMTSPLISSLAAYMMVTGQVLPMGTVLVWMIALAVLGVLFAFPLKKRFINDEQQPFPEGRAAGVVMDALHTSDASVGLFKAKLLLITGGAAALLKIAQSHDLMTRLKLGFLAIPEYLDGWFYALGAKFLTWTPSILGTPLRELSVRPDTDFVMMAAGGLMGIRTGVSLMVGAAINYLVIAPWMIAAGEIPGNVAADGTVTYGFRTILKWSLWGGVAMMTTSSLFAFFSKPRVLISGFVSLFRRAGGGANRDVLRDIELPLSVFAVGIPVVGTLVVLLAHHLFGVKFWVAALAIPLVFVFALIAANSTGLTSITPLSAIGQLTQLLFGWIAPGSMTTTLITAGVTAEVASHSSNLLMDIKPGYMLGAKPRQQAIGHVLGVLAGAMVAVPVFYAVFLHGGVAQLVSSQYPLPSANTWKAVAELMTRGIANLPESARWAVLVGALLGIGLEAVKLATKGRFWLSGVGVGLATIIPFNTCFAMFLGGALFWWAGRRFKRPGSRAHAVMVENQETVCAGVIAGGAITGIVVILIENFVLNPR